jgi:hypothetical protein
MSRLPSRTSTHILLNDKWNDNLESIKSFFVGTGRMLTSTADGDMERRLGTWIANNKKKEGGTGSECKQLLRRGFPLAFRTSTMFFLATSGMIIFSFDHDGPQDLAPRRRTLPRTADFGHNRPQKSAPCQRTLSHTADFDHDMGLKDLPLVQGLCLVQLTSAKMASIDIQRASRTNDAFH